MGLLYNMNIVRSLERFLLKRTKSVRQQKAANGRGRHIAVRSKRGNLRKNFSAKKPKKLAKSLKKQLTLLDGCDMINRLLIRQRRCFAAERNIDNCIEQYKV